MDTDIETIFDISDSKLFDEDYYEELETKNNEYQKIKEEINELQSKIKKSQEEQRKDLFLGTLTIAGAYIIAKLFDNDPEEILIMGFGFFGAGALLGDIGYRFRETNYSLVPKLEELYEEYPELKKEKPKVRRLGTK